MSYKLYNILLEYIFSEILICNKLQSACLFPSLVIFCCWAHPVQARESGAGTAIQITNAFFPLLVNIKTNQTNTTKEQKNGAFVINIEVGMILIIIAF